VGNEIIPGGTMAVRKQALKLFLNEPSPQELAEDADGQAIGNAIFQYTLLLANGFDPMGVFPMGKRAGNLHITELYPLLIIAMLSDPT
jgi:hypothetical protein